MRQKVHIAKQNRTVTITDTSSARPSSTVATFLAKGGEASVYQMQGNVLKIYHDSNKAIPENKIQELSVLNINPSIVAPKNLVYGKGNKIVGYVMSYVLGADPLCQFFPKAYKKRHSISQNDIAEMVKNSQSILDFIHSNDILVVDLNELNILAKRPPNANGAMTFIDVDSYQTKNFPATAIMESIRDRQIKGLKWDEGSDWFSWACIMFNLYTNIHPYMGKHPSYTGEKNGRSRLEQRMDDNISIFDKDVSYPKGVVNDFGVIPRRHLDWFKSVFVHGDRMPPPLPDMSVPLVVDSQINIIRGNVNFDVVETLNFEEDIIAVFSLFGSQYYTTRNYVYREGRQILSKTSPNKAVGFSDKMQPVIMSDAVLYDKDGNKILSVTSNEFFGRNGKIYNLNHDSLNLIETKTLNHKIFANESKLDSVSFAAKKFDGVVIQNLLGQVHLTIPYDEKKSCTVKVEELNDYRILDARSEDKFTVIVAEKGGKYSRFIVIIDYGSKTYHIKETKNVMFDIINFTVIRGMCILMIDSNSIALFKDLKTIRLIDNTPFDSSCVLFNDGNGVFFCDGPRVYSLKMK